MKTQKIAICVLSTLGFHQKKLWKTFLKQHADKFNVYMHNKTKLEDCWESKFDIKDKIETNWGDISLVRATLKLFNEAFKNTENRYFVLVSGDSLPSLTGEDIYAHYMTTEENRICCWNFNKNKKKLNLNRFNKMNSDIFSDKHYVKHQQWVAFNRKTTKFLISNDYTSHFEKVLIPDENYFGTVLTKFKFNFDIGARPMNMYASWAESDKLCGEERPPRYSNMCPIPMSEIKKRKTPFIRKVETEEFLKLPEDYCRYIGLSEHDSSSDK